MSCCNKCNCLTCCCHAAGQPVSSSGPAVCAASCVTSGTNDTINALIGSATSTLGAVFGAKQQQQATAVKAQVQLAQSKYNSMTIVAVAVIALIGFFAFARAR